MPLAKADWVSIPAEQDADVMDERHRIDTPEGESDTIIIYKIPGFHVGYGLIKFSLSSIPNGSTITLAKLKLFNVNTAASTQNFATIKIGRITQSWSENTVTYNNRPSFVDTGVSTSVGRQNAYYEWDVTQVVKDWKSNRFSNYGFFLSGPSFDTSYQKFFESKEGESGKRPQLYVEYTPRDTKGPVITEVNHSAITQTSAKITWKTDESSSSIVLFGTSQTQPNLTAGQRDRVRTHTVILSSLQPDTTYYYRVNSLDSLNNPSISASGTNFKTLALVSSPTPSPSPIINTSAKPTSKPTNKPSTSAKPSPGLLANKSLEPQPATFSGFSNTNVNPSISPRRSLIGGVSFSALGGALIGLGLFLVILVSFYFTNKDYVMRLFKLKEKEISKEDEKEES